METLPPQVNTDLHHVTFKLLCPSSELSRILPFLCMQTHEELTSSKPVLILGTKPTYSEQKYPFLNFLLCSRFMTGVEALTFLFLQFPYSLLPTF